MGPIHADGGISRAVLLTFRLGTTNWQPWRAALRV